MTADRPPAGSRASPGKRFGSIPRVPNRQLLAGSCSAPDGAQDAAQGRRDLARRQRAGCRLVQERWKRG